MPDARRRLRWTNRFSHARDRQIRHIFRPPDYNLRLSRDCQTEHPVEPTLQTYYLVRLPTASLPRLWRKGVSAEVVYVALNDLGVIEARFNKLEKALAAGADIGVNLVWVQ